MPTRNYAVGLVTAFAAIATASFAESAQAAAFAPDYSDFEASAVVSNGGVAARITKGLAQGQNGSVGGAFSDFSALSGLVEVNFNSSQASGSSAFTVGGLTFAAEKGFGTKGTQIKADNWAPSNPDGSKNSSNYLAIFNGNKVTVSLGQTMNYFGINWGALSRNNTFTLLREGNVVASFNYNSINPVAPTYAAHQRENNAYLHLYAESEDSLFDTLVLEQASTDGGGFEVDNFSYVAASEQFNWEDSESVPEPGLALGLVAMGGLAVLKRRDRQAEQDA